MLRALDIYKTYVETQTPLEVLKGVDFVVEHGEFVSLVGPSGAGKSTLLHILGGLDKPTQGQVFLEGEDIYQMTDARRSLVRNSKLGFVFQFYHLLPEFNALENVIMPALVKQGFSAKKCLEQKGLELLEKVGMKARALHKPKQLSGGEQQRLAIARALINDPQIIFCDEPTGNLDSKSGENIMGLLLQLNRDYRQAVVMVTHDQNLAKKAKRSVHMQDGKLINYH
ncbi:MAG: ABC transporter ATP-binding protein [Candidatus Omnitrophica bacterium]|nr:ABC transporter ATP-binding protein [Candidatus Omnitrophota bacterium]